MPTEREENYSTTMIVNNKEKTDTVLFRLTSSSMNQWYQTVMSQCGHVERYESVFWRHGGQKTVENRSNRSRLNRNELDWSRLTSEAIRLRVQPSHARANRTKRRTTRLR